MQQEQEGIRNRNRNRNRNKIKNKYDLFIKLESGKNMKCKLTQRGYELGHGCGAGHIPNYQCNAINLVVW